MSFLKKPLEIPNKIVFLFLWALTAALYLPAAKAGWVIDASGWLYHIRHEDFWSYMNRTTSHVESLYQFTQFITWVFYKLWGANPWLWSLLYITFHALNAYLLFLICKTLFTDSGMKSNILVPLFGIILFTVSPYISEALIWKACYHYLQGLLFILFILRVVQQYHHTQKPLFIILAVLVFLLAAFSLEVFYLIPFFVLTLAMYYRWVVGFNKLLFRKTVLYFVLPEIIIFCIYLALLRYTYHTIRPHVYNIFSQSITEYLSRPPKYLFHLLLFGRFFPVHIKQQIYSFCDTPAIQVLFYILIAAMTSYFFLQYRKKDNVAALLILLLLWIMLAIAILMPLPFPDPALLLFYDRYTYFTDGFFYVFLSVLLWRYIGKHFYCAVFAILAGISIFFTIRLNLYWKHSAYINNRLLTALPPLDNKIVVLLNLPENLNGVPMLGADPDGEYKAMYEIMNGTALKNTVYDAASYNLTTMHDGAHAVVLNDSTIQVTLNQWGTWWWYEGHGGRSYENNDYKLNMKEPGRFYELTLKHAPAEYMLLYQVEGVWKVVDWNKKGVEQD